jgi:flagellar assembly factor FliW
MRLNTVRFGEIDIADEKIIKFPEGIPGLENLTRYALISNEETEPFKWFQAMDNPEIALVVIDPNILFPKYYVNLSPEIVEELKLDEGDDTLILTVAVVPRDFKQMTTNLVSPIVINASKNLGKQIIMQTSEYQIRQPIFDLLQEYVNGGESDAGSDA